MEPDFERRLTGVRTTGAHVADEPNKAPAKKAPAATSGPSAAPSSATAADEAAPTHHVPRWRRIIAGTLLVIACILVPLSLSAVWVRNTLLDSDNYVATVGPLAGNSNIQHGIADRITTALFADGTVQTKIADVLPPKAAVLAGPISSGLEGVANTATLKLVQSDKFQTVWDNVNAKAHGAVVKVLTGGGPRVSTKDGTVSLNVEQIFTNVKAKLDARGITLFDSVQLPAKYQSVVLFQSKTLEQVQGGVDLLQTMAWVLPFILLVLFGAAIALSSNRRRTVLRGGIGVALAVGVQLALLSAGRNFYLDAITNAGLRRGSAGAVWDQVTSFLRLSGTTVIAIALVVAIAAWVAGSSKLATRIRGLWNNAIGGGADADAPISSFASFVARSKSGLRLAGVGVAIVILIVWNHPKPVTVLGVAVLLVIYLALVEFIGRGAPAPVDADPV